MIIIIIYRIIDLSEYQTCEKKPPVVWIAELSLYESDKKILLDSVGWLHDTLINASQKLLKQQFPSICSLQNVDLGQIMAFKILSKNGGFLQILHSLSNHWLTVSGTGSKSPIKVYDSLNSFIPNMIKCQIACLLCSENSPIEINIMDVKSQVQLITEFIFILICYNQLYRLELTIVEFSPSLMQLKLHMAWIQHAVFLSKEE